MTQRLIFSLLFSVSLLLIFTQCKKDSVENDVIYKKPIEKLDPTCKWLSEESNYTKSNYMMVFYKHRNELIKKGNVNEIADLLDIVSKTLDSNFALNEDFLNLTLDFLKENENKIDDKFFISLNNFIGCHYTNKEDFQKAIVYYKKATIKKPHDYYTHNNLGNVYYNLSYCYMSIGKQNLALEESLNSLKNFEKTDNYSGKGLVYNNFSNIYLALKKYNEAEQNIDKALAIYKTQKDTNNLFVSLINKICIYNECKSEKLNALVDSTYNYCNKISNINLNYKIPIYCFYAEKLISEDKITEAGKILEEVKPLLKKIDESFAVEDYTATLSIYELKTGKGISDAGIYLKIIPSLKKSKDYQALKTIYSLLKEDAILKNDYKSALFFSDEYKNAMDSLSNENIQVKVAEIEEKYQLDKKNELLNKKENDLVNKNNLIFWLILGFTIMGLFFLIYLLYQKQNSLKKDKKNNSMFTNKLFQNTEDERKRIATDLHDGISQELLALKNNFSGELSDLNCRIDNIINEIRIISRNLHPVMFDKIGLQCTVEQMVERIQDKDEFLVTSDVNYNKSLTVQDELQVYRIIQEAMSNIIKYSKATAAKIIIDERESSIKLKIIDNGNGFDVEKTLNGDKAFGLHSIIERTKNLKGTAIITSSSNGTTISIKLPIPNIITENNPNEK